MSTHVALFSVPIPALVNPTLSLVATLVRRGYRVTYVTSERFAPEVSALGAHVLRCPRLDAPFDQPDDDSMPMEHQHVHTLVDLAARTLRATWPFFARHGVDHVIYESIAFAGKLVAQKSGATAARMSNQFAYSARSLASRVIPEEWREAQLELGRQADEFMATQGSGIRNVIFDNNDPTFYFYPRELQLTEPVTGPVFHAPRCIAERPNVAPWKARSAGVGRRALLASSTTYAHDTDYYKNCLAELAKLGWQTVLAASASGGLAQFAALPSHCQPVENAVLAAIMPHVDLVICAAGMASAMEAAYHGIPMLMLTGGHAELEAYADKFQEQRMGVHLKPNSASAPAVAQCAAGMLDDSELLLGVNRMQRIVRTGAGAEELVNWLEDTAVLPRR